MQDIHCQNKQSGISCKNNQHPVSVNFSMNKKGRRFVWTTNKPPWDHPKKLKAVWKALVKLQVLIWTIPPAACRRRCLINCSLTLASLWTDCLHRRDQLYIVLFIVCTFVLCHHIIWWIVCVLSSGCLLNGHFCYQIMFLCYMKPH